MKFIFTLFYFIDFTSSWSCWVRPSICAAPVFSASVVKPSFCGCTSVGLFLRELRIELAMGWVLWTWTCDFVFFSCFDPCFKHSRRKFWNRNACLLNYSNVSLWSKLLIIDMSWLIYLIWLLKDDSVDWWLLKSWLTFWAGEWLNELQQNVLLFFYLSSWSWPEVMSNGLNLISGSGIDSG